MFVGEVGPHYRRTFTVMGDAVKLAARLMAKAAPGGDHHDAGARGPVADGVRGDGIEPFLVKGKAKPVRAVRLGAISRDATGVRR